jgi:hypothetical protein
MLGVELDCAADETELSNMPVGEVGKTVMASVGTVVSISIPLELELELDLVLVLVLALVLALALVIRLDGCGWAPDADLDAVEVC